MAKEGRTENLVPTNLRTKEEARELGAKGGKASGEARRKKAQMSEMFGRWLAEEHKIKLDGKEQMVTGLRLIELVNLKIIMKGDSTSVALQKLMLEATEGTKFEIESTVENVDLTAGMTYEQKQARINAILARRNRN